MESKNWYTNVVGDNEDCTPGMCGACCVYPAIEEATFHKPPYTPCPDLDQNTLLCNSWPNPKCGLKNWTCRSNVNKYSDPHIYRGQLITQKNENIKKKWQLLKRKILG